MTEDEMVGWHHLLSGSPSTEAGLLAPQPIPAAEPFLTLSPTFIC